ncbi:MAG: purine-nucleoside phosphorylase [Acutalibacter sp.]|jgi:purine-nucleoside phosphorylase|nr:purine-nucleoside phosphorylase [Acutalibacter sp.]
MGAVWERIEGCAAAIRRHTDFQPEAALVLGSGLGGFGDLLRTEAAVGYGEIAGFPTSTVPGHAGQFLFGYVENRPVVVMQGRIHYYEGYSMEDVVLPIRVMGALGAKELLLTNAAGGVDRGLAPGDLMLLTGQITSFVPSPLIGPNQEELGPRFPDMTEVYSLRLRGRARDAAERLGIPLKEGVYLQTTGPNYETPPEIQMFSLLGASAVGMSTACEAMAARHMGMEVCGISCITNMAAGISERPLSHAEVQEAADKASGNFQRLVWEYLRQA